MKIYDDSNKNRIYLVQTVPSASTFVSSITGIIKNYIIGAFPKQYFRYIYTDTSETFQEMNKNKLYNKSLDKIPLPAITISPQLSIDNPVGGMKNILMSAPNFWLSRDLNRQYPVLLEDDEKKYKLYFTSDYTTLNVRFKIVVNSFQQATNLSYFLKSRFNDETFKYLSHQKIQVEIPKKFVNSIAKMDKIFDCRQNTTNNAEDFEKLSVRLRSLGRRAGTIVPKTSMSTGQVGFFFEEESNLLTLFTDLDIPEGIIRDGGVSGEYEITFRVQVSAWWPNAFILDIDKSRIQEIEYFVKSSDRDSVITGDFYPPISIGGPIALDRTNVYAFRDLESEEHIGISVLHQVYNYNAVSGITKINAANVIFNNGPIIDISSED